MEFSEKFERVCEILDEHNREPHKLIKILQDVQAEYSYLPEEVMLYVATAVGVSASSVYGVATFYSHFTLEPKGKYVIKVCDGTACHVKKSKDILVTIKNELGLEDGEKTSKDGLFSLETVACLGACGIAPVIVINDDVHGSMTKDATVELIKKIRMEDAANV